MLIDIFLFFCLCVYSPAMDASNKHQKKSNPVFNDAPLNFCSECTRKVHYPVMHDYTTQYLVHGKYIPANLFCPICADEGLQNAHTVRFHLDTVVSSLERTSLAQKYGVPHHQNYDDKAVQTRRPSFEDWLLSSDCDFSFTTEADAKQSKDGQCNNTSNTAEQSTQIQHEHTGTKSAPSA